MSRIHTVSSEEAIPEVKQFYDILSKKIGRLPNIFQHMGNSPALLHAYLHLSESLNKTQLSPKLREEIALAVSQANNCHYCLNAHTAIGGSLGLNPQELLQARKGEDKDPKNQAILHFAKKIVEKRGNVQDADVAEVKKAGVNDREIAEIILVVIANLFTNYFNHVVDPVSDFPAAPPLN